MIIDCFTYFNEQDILDIRLATLDECVDAFVLVEAERSQSLISKPLFFDQNKQRYQKYLHKIIHVIVRDEECSSFKPNTWEMEHFQRNSIMRGLDEFEDSDIVMISDCDEIPRPTEVKALSAHGILPLSMKMSHRVFYANLELAGSQWIGTICMTKGMLKSSSPQSARAAKDSTPCRDTLTGWHLSYMGGKEAAYNKLFSCIEPLDKSLIPSWPTFSTEFDRKIKDRGSFLFSDRIDDSKELVQNDELPAACAKYKNLLWKPT